VLEALKSKHHDLYKLPHSDKENEYIRRYISAFNDIEDNLRLAVPTRDKNGTVRQVIQAYKTRYPNWQHDTTVLHIAAVRNGIHELSQQKYSRLDFTEADLLWVEALLDGLTHGQGLPERDRWPSCMPPWEVNSPSPQNGALNANALPRPIEPVSQDTQPERPSAGGGSPAVKLPSDHPQEATEAASPDSPNRSSGYANERPTGKTETVFSGAVRKGYLKQEPTRRDILIVVCCLLGLIAFGIANSRHDANKSMKPPPRSDKHGQKPPPRKTDAEYLRLLAQAKAAFGRHDRKQAVHLAKLSVSEHPNDEAYKVLGASYGLDGNISQSIGAYRRAIELDPTDMEARLGLATAFKKGNRYQEAESVYRFVLEDLHTTPHQADTAQSLLRAIEGERH
jgi:tetratricopeptide (TPR) repeat protein